MFNLPKKKTEFPFPKHKHKLKYPNPYMNIDGHVVKMDYLGGRSKKEVLTGGRSEEEFLTKHFRSKKILAVTLNKNIEQLDIYYKKRTLR
jgi:hypothetical protein